MKVSQGKTDNYKFSKQEIKFLRECIKWSRISYEERARKYFDIPGYKEGCYREKLEMMERIELKLMTKND